jgi:tRNA(adenine34) deaminase
MCGCNRRAFLTGAAACLATPALGDTVWTERIFIAAAFKQLNIAITAGDQPYGAVIVHGAELQRGVVGAGRSRVRELGALAGHAEVQAVRNAQERLGTTDLSGYVMYSTSRPCRACERAAAEAKIARVYFGEAPTDAGAPRP